MELNREQIIKALEYCSAGEIEECRKCHRHHIDTLTDAECMEGLMREVIPFIKELTEDNQAQAETIKSLIETIKYIQADTIKVVRCKDCKESEVCPDTLLWCNQFERLIPPMGFCHCGEKKKGE